MADVISADGGLAPSPSAAEIAAAFAAGETSARAATEAALARLAAVEPQLCAFCTVDADAALAEADAVDTRRLRGEDAGPLAGVPVAVKDLIPTRRLRTTFGSPLYRDHVPDSDDVVVARLRAAGAIVLGKTNTSEFGYGPVGRNPLFAPTRNPWNTALTPGGSSAGSAAAVAAGVTPLALGSDGGGSIRIPAALTGVIGFKPSWGRLPLYPGCRDETMPGASGWESLEHIGPITRTVADAALAMAALAGPSPLDRHSIPLEFPPRDWLDLAPAPLGGARLAFSPDLGFAAVDSEVATIAAAAATDLAGALGTVLSDAAPETGDVQPLFEALVALDTDRAGLGAMATACGHTFPDPLAGLLATRWTADAFTTAIMARKRTVNVLARFMERFDFLLTPSVAVAAFPVELDGPARIGGRAVPPSAWTPFSALANLSGQPAISVPAGWTRDGLPVGLQIVGRHLDDRGVLRAAAALEAARPFAGAWPPVAVGRAA